MKPFLFLFTWVFFGVFFIFPSLIFALEKPFLQGVIEEKKLDTWKTDQKVEQSDLVMGTLMTLAEEAWQNNNKALAIAYAEKASLFSPESPLPHFFLSHILRLFNREEGLRALGEYATGVKLSLSHFWFLSFSIGVLAITACMAVFFSTMTFLCYILVIYFPQWIHFIQERLPYSIHPYSIVLVLVLLFIVLFFILPPFWIILVGLFLFSFFYRAWEKRVAIFLSMGLVFVTFLFAPSLVFLTAKQFPLINKMVSNQQGEYIWTEPIFLPAMTNDSDWRVSFLKAAYQTQQKDFIRAEELYQQALSKKPDSVMILNNLGNTFFYRDKLDQALEYYQRAIRSDAGYITAHYNISQVYNEQLLFHEGELKYIETKKIDQERAKYFSKIVTEYPNYPVIEGRFTEKEIWKEMLDSIIQFKSENVGKIWRLWVGDIQLMQFVMLIFFISLGIFGLSVYLSHSISGDLCSICFRAICKRCQIAFSDNTICGECSKNLKIAVSKKRGSIPKRVYPFFILPGGGHLVRQKPFFAFFLLISFFFIAVLMTIGDLFRSSAQWHLSIENPAVLYLALFLLYSFSIYDLIIKRRRSQWR